MADERIRHLERAHEFDALAWRPLLAELVRIGRGPEALAMLERTEERLHEQGRMLVVAARHEAYCGATVRTGTAAFVAHMDETLAVAAARVALDNDLALGRKV